MDATELTALGNVCCRFPIRLNYKEITGKKGVSAVCLSPLTEPNCAGGSLCSLTVHSCCLTCARGLSCTHCAWSHQTVPQAQSIATWPNPLGCSPPALCPSMSKTCHYSTFGMGSSFHSAGRESDASHVESGHIPPGTSAQQGGFPSSLPMVASAPLEQIHSLHGPITSATAAKRKYYNSKCNLSTKT